MELDQVRENLKWLDEERRRDKNALAALDERLNGVENNLPSLTQQIKELSGEVTRLSALMGRFDQIEETILQQRIESKHAIDELEKEVRKREDDNEKVRRVELRAIDDNIAELRKDLANLGELKPTLQARVEEEARLGKAIETVRQSIENMRRSEEEYTRSYRLIEDGRRQDGKRLTDLQGEVTALRKQTDDQRGKMELTTSTLRKLEARLNELAMLEAERRDAQTDFMEKQAMQQVERDRTWKDWQARFETIESQTADVEGQLQSLDATHRAVKRSQQSLEDLSQLVDRRINEMTEIQRLSEERFRQEWVTFKADDQKRWTNYTLTQEEQRGEVKRQYDRLNDRITHTEDTLQEVQDILQQMNNLTEKRLQSLLASIHEWVSAYERSLGGIVNLLFPHAPITTSNTKPYVFDYGLR